MNGQRTSRRPARPAIAALLALWSIVMLAGCATLAPGRAAPPPAEVKPELDDSCRCGDLGGRQALVAAGWGEAVVNRTLVEYYVPPRRPGAAAPRELTALIHGAGFCHFGGAVANIREWRRWADENDTILISPAFERGYRPGEAVDPRWLPGSGRRNLGEAPCACEFNAQCEQFEVFRRIGWRPFFYRAPDEHLWDFVHLTNRVNGERADVRLNEIVRHFQMQFATEDRFSLYGYSGGGQFVARYMMLHPDRLKRAAAGGAGSFMFPAFDKLYPFGLAGAVGRDRFSREEWQRRLVQFFELPVAILAGDADFVGVGEHPDSAWQGLGQATIARNFVYAMSRADASLKAAGLRPPDAPFRISLVEFPDRNHDEARRAAVAWLQQEWQSRPPPPPQ